MLRNASTAMGWIAARAQLGDASTLWRIFTRYLGVTPADYRARFAACVAKG
jgi:transcriptional regulator GlxA family with amidase domain